MQSKKELKDQYKQMKIKMGVFQIRNTTNGKIYIDGNTNLDAIWNRTRMELEYGNYRNAALQSDWKTFGAEHFVFEILAEIEQKDGEEAKYKTEINELKKMYLEELKPFGDKGYN